MGYIVRKSTSIEGRKYPDGESIPDSLPGLYRPSDRCNNCGAYVPNTQFCITWDAVIRSDYVCAVWVPIKG